LHNNKTRAGADSSAKLNPHKMKNYLKTFSKQDAKDLIFALAILLAGITALYLVEYL
jgi:hypothetical protein